MKANVYCGAISSFMTEVIIQIKNVARNSILQTVKVTALWSRLMII